MLLLFQIILIAMYVISMILLLDLFYAEKKIEYFYWRKFNLEYKMDHPNSVWATKQLFWNQHKATEYLFWVISLIPLINTFYYLYALWYLNNSSFGESPLETRWQRIYRNGYSINSYIWLYLKKILK